MCSKSSKKRVQKFTEFFNVLPIFQLKITHSCKRFRGHSQKALVSRRVYYVAMKIGPFVSFSKWSARQHWLRVHSVFFTVCTFDPTSPFFPKLCAWYFPSKFSFFFLAWICYTAGCNVLTLWKSSCSSTLPIFVQWTKDSPYLNLNLGSKRYLYHHTKQPTEIAALWVMRVE